MSKRKREMAIARKEFNKRREETLRDDVHKLAGHYSKLASRYGLLSLINNTMMGVDESEPDKESTTKTMIMTLDSSTSTGKTYSKTFIIKDVETIIDKPNELLKELRDCYDGKSKK